MNITGVQLNYIVGDFEYNYKKIRDAIIYHNTSDLIVFSELCITGYYPYDLLNYDFVIKNQFIIISKIKKLTKRYKTSVVVGLATPIAKTNKFYNTAYVIEDGKIIFVYHKKLIPNHSIFEEARHFLAGNETPIFHFKGIAFALFICEDLWFHISKQYQHSNPISVLRSNSVDVVISINASPSMICKDISRFQISKLIVKITSAYFFYVSQIGGYDNIVYDGSSFALNKKSQLVKRAKKFVEDSFTVNITNSQEKLLPFNITEDNESYVLNHITLGLKDYVKKTGFKGVVVGSSGGIDSALTIVLAKLSLGSDNVTAITMPSTYSSLESVRDSINLCELLKVNLFKYDINQEFLDTIKKFTIAFGCPPKKVTKENLQSRIRGRTLMAYANNENLLLISTSNRSELAIGYSTLYGDMCGSLNCIGDLYKEEVYKLSHFINKKYGNIIPKEIIDKIPSAELSENQKDSDDIPDYDNLDSFLRFYLDKDYLTKKEYDFSKNIVNKMSLCNKKSIHQMIHRSEFKRQQAPPVIVLRPNSLSLGRKTPITACYASAFSYKDI